MEEEVIQRVSELMDAIHLKLRTFSQEIGIPESTLKQQLNGKEGRGRGVQMAVIAAILNKYQNLSAEWLLRGKGTMFLHEYTEDSKFRMNPNNSEDVVSLMSILSRFLSNQEQYQAIMKDMMVIYERINNK